MSERSTDRSGPAAVISGLVAAAVTFLVYIPALSNGFVNWDDPLYVYENKLIRNLDLEFVRHVFTSSVVSNWHPLTMISYAIDYSLWGLSPFGYHLENVILHALNTFLTAVVAFKLADKAFKKGADHLPALFAGFFTALLFGLHPLHVESVAWVSEKKDVLSGFFFLLSILTYLKYAEGGRRRLFYGLTLLFFMLALLSKPMAITLPAVLLIIDRYPLGRFGLGSRGGEFKKTVLEKIPFFILSGASAVITIFAQSTALVSMEKIPLAVRVFTAVRAYAFYLYKSVFPVDLAPVYPHPMRLDFLSYQYAGALVISIIITVLCVIFYKRYKVLMAVWLYYLITLLPVSGIVQVGMQSAADRYMYIPSLGPFILAGAVAGLFFRSSKKGQLPAAMAVVVLLTVAMGWKTVNQTRIWKDPVSFWSHELEYLDTVKAAKELINLNREKLQSVPPVVLAYYKRGIAYARINDNARAVEDLSRVIELNPDFFDAYVQRGTVFGKTGENERALEDFDMAIKLSPRYPTAYNNRGMVYMHLGDNENARKDFEMAEFLKSQKRGI